MRSFLKGCFKGSLLGSVRVQGLRFGGFLGFGGFRFRAFFFFGWFRAYRVQGPRAQGFGAEI